MRDEIYGTSWRHLVLARIADRIGEALAIAEKAFGARVLQFLPIESSDIGIVAPGNYSSMGKVSGQQIGKEGAVGVQPGLFTIAGESVDEPDSRRLAGYR